MKHTYFPSKMDDERRHKAILKAKARGEAMNKWLSEGNKLTPITMEEFRKLMKDTDKNFKP